MATYDISSQPHNREAEMAVIGSVLIHSDAYFDVAGMIKAGDFYIVRHQWIWEALDRLNERKVPLDTLTVSQEIENAGRLEEIGGTAYLMSLINQTPTSMHAEAYAKKIKEESTRRHMLSAANKIAKLAYDTEKKTEEIVTGCISSVLEIAGDAIAGDTRTSGEVFSSVYDQMDELSKRPTSDLPGVPSGLYDLDKLLSGGFQKSKLYVVGARPGQGKTSLLLSILHHATLKKDFRAAVFSLEMDNDELGQRLISIDSGIDGQTIQTGKLSDNQWTVFTNSVERLSNAPIIFDDTATITPAQMRAKCKRIQAQYGLDMILIDYLGLLQPDRQHRNRVDEVSEISRSLKQLSREIKVPVLSAHQLNRAVEQRADHSPQLSDLRDSGSIEQDADVVLLMHQDEMNSSLVHLQVAKQRSGPTGFMDLHFKKNTTHFVSAAR